jgi:hypothetical protein
MRLVIREEDVLKALQAPVVKQEIQNLLRGLNTPKTKQVEGDTPERSRIPQRIQDLRNRLDEYRISNPNVEFLEGGRVKLEFEVEELKAAQKLKIQIESGIDFTADQRLTLLRPILRLNGEEIPEPIVQAFVSGFLSRFSPEQLGSLLPGNLGQVKWSQLTARVIKLQVKDKKLELVAFLRLPQGLKI